MAGCRVLQIVQKECNESRYKKSIYPGETITISAVVVGGDYGTTVGTVYAGFIGHNIFKWGISPHLNPELQRSQVISLNTQCSDLSYTITAREHSMAVMYLATISYNSDEIKQFYYYPWSDGPTMTRA